jgi:hypothetical protein
MVDAMASRDDTDGVDHDLCVPNKQFVNLLSPTDLLTSVGLINNAVFYLIPRTLTSEGTRRSTTIHRFVTFRKILREIWYIAFLTH